MAIAVRGSRFAQVVRWVSDADFSPASATAEELQWTPLDAELMQEALSRVEQAWFWTPAWQSGEQEASDELRDGAGQVFETAEDFLGSFDEPS